MFKKILRKEKVIEPRTRCRCFPDCKCLPDLKKCPFCGGDAELRRMLLTESYQIKCDNESCFFGGQLEGQPVSLIEKWNKRV